MSSIGVRWYLRQKIDAQCAASENANVQIAIKYWFFFAKHGKLLASFYSIWLYLKKKSSLKTFCHWQKGSGSNWFYYIRPFFA